MARPRNATPSYLLHRRSGQARVRLRVGGRFRDFYLGPFNSPESWEKYHRLLAERHREGKSDSEAGLAPKATASRDLSIAALVVEYDGFARQYYVKNGEVTNDRFKAGVEPLVSLYGSTSAHEFGPNKLRSVREHIISRGNANSAEYDDVGGLLKPGEPLCRTYVNSLIREMIRMFKWAVAHELIPVVVYDALTKVEGIRKGKDARLREPDPVRPVSDEHFWPVVKAVAPQIGTMLQVQKLSGMRPDEVTIIRPCDVDQREELWVYRPNSHKLDWRGQEKEVLFGPKAQALLRPWLVGRAETDYLFSPKEVLEASLKRRRKRRASAFRKPVRARRKRGIRAHYTDDTYRQAVQRACKRVGVPAWSPGRLRHNAGTDVRRKYGAEAAQLVLGHRNLSTTEIYAEKNRGQYEQIMKEIG